MELPRFDYQRYNMRPEYRFVYASSQRSRAPEPAFTTNWSKPTSRPGGRGPGSRTDCYPGEPVFVGQRRIGEPRTRASSSPSCWTRPRQVFPARPGCAVVRRAGPGPGSRILFCSATTASFRGTVSHDLTNKIVQVRERPQELCPVGDDQVEVLKGISFDIHAGEFVALVGASGNGKSTLLNMVTGIDHPSQGEVLVAGRAIHTMKENELAVWRGESVGIVFQFFQLLPALSLLQNVVLPMDFARRLSTPGAPGAGHAPARVGRARRPGAQAAQHGLWWAATAGRHRPRPGQRPPLLVADEPTGNLDARTSADVFDLFTRLADEGTDPADGHTRAGPGLPGAPHPGDSERHRSSRRKLQPGTGGRIVPPLPLRRPNLERSIVDMSVLWRKVWFDLWHHKGRTLLAILSVAAGVFALGAILGLVDQLLSGMDEAHRSVVPSHISVILRTHVPEETAEEPTADRGRGRRRACEPDLCTLQSRPDDEWALGTLVMRPDYRGSDLRSGRAQRRVSGPSIPRSASNGCPVSTLASTWATGSSLELPAE
jgi:putative ABC transport system ATP-binding protein